MTELENAHAEFCALVQDDVEHLIRTTPEAYLMRYWYVQCYKSIAAFAERFPTSEARVAALEDVKRAMATVQVAEQKALNELARIDLRSIVPPCVLPGH